jgi:molecular chaperone GrpE (heat shock protein)
MIFDYQVRYGSSIVAARQGRRMQIPLDETGGRAEAQDAEGGSGPAPEAAPAGPAPAALEPERPDDVVQTPGAEQPPEAEQLPDLSEAERAPESEGPDLAGLEASIAGFDTRLEESHRLLARQSDLVDRLHAENQDLRAGELRNAQLPLVRDLLRLHDDVGRMREAAGEPNGESDDIRLVQESLLDVLARNGVEPFAPGEGEPLDPRLHAVAGTEPIAEEPLDKSVAAIVKRGFRWDSGDVIRVAEIRAYRYQGASQDAPET